MILLTTYPIIISTCNLALKNIPLCREVFKRTIGIPFEPGEVIRPIEKKEYTDLPLFKGDIKYCVAPSEQLIIINSIDGFYNENKQFQIFDNSMTSYLLRELQIPDNLFITNYLIEGKIHNTVSRKDVEIGLYVPIETIHGKFELLERADTT